MSFRSTLLLVVFLASGAEAKYTAQIDADTLVLTGNGASDPLAIRLTAGDPTHLDVDVDDDGTADFSFDRSLFSAIAISAGGGSDTVRVDETNGLFTDEKILIDGGPGDDTLTGGSGDDTIVGGGGDDTINPRRGSDVVQAGGGNDVVIWNPGDGSDVVEGEGGHDRLVFNGSNANEEFDFSANGPRARMTRNVASIVMDLNGVEEVDLLTLGGTDLVTVNDLTGTDLAHVNVDLNGVGGVADGAVDTVVVTGTAGPDVVSVGANGGVLEVDGVGSQVLVTSTEQQDALTLAVNGADELHVLGTSGPDTMFVTPSPDPTAVRTIVDSFPVAVDIRNGGKLVLFGLGDNDTIAASNGIRMRGTSLEIDGGAGDDTLTGGDGDDVIFAGGGDDVVRGGIGSDVMNLGAGKDTAVWNPGDGSDVVEGDAGNDTLLFAGSNAAEVIEVSPNGTRARLTRNIASITMDLNAIEQIQIQARGSADDITVDDLSGTGVNAVTVDLAATPGSVGGDGAIDTVRVNGTDAADKFTLKPTPTGVAVNNVFVDNPETTDVLVVNGLGGTDKFIVDPGVSAAISLTLNPD